MSGTLIAQERVLFSFDAPTICVAEPIAGVSESNVVVS